MTDEQDLNEIRRGLNQIQTLTTKIETYPELLAPGLWGKKHIVKKYQEIQDHCQWISECISGPYDTEPGGDYYDTEPIDDY